MKTKKTSVPNVYRDENNRILYYLTLGTDQLTGKRIQKRSYKDANGYPFRTLREAQAEATRVKNEYFKQNGYSDYTITYDVFMNQVYLPFYQSDVKPQTYETRESAIRLAIERFHGKKLRDVTVRDAENYRIWLLNESGFSQSYASMVYNTFRKSLNYAVKLGYLSTNEAMKTDAISKTKAKVAYWTKAEFEKVVSTFYLPDYYEHMSFIMIWLYFMSGIRVSEGLALTWNDVDLRQKTLTISHSLNRQKAGNYDLYGDTKTENGHRKIALDDDTIRFLTDWHKVQLEHGANQLVMSTNDKPLYRSTVQRIIRRHAKVAGVKSIQGKGLRHSAVSFLINEFNADVLVVSRRLGHSDPSITLKHYSHLWPVNDGQITKLMTGNVHVQFAEKKQIHFNGNQHIHVS